jgi:hypothetical protein
MTMFDAFSQLLVKIIKCAVVFSLSFFRHPFDYYSFIVVYLSLMANTKRAYEKQLPINCIQMKEKNYRTLNLIPFMIDWQALNIKCKAAGGIVLAIKE